MGSLPVGWKIKRQLPFGFALETGREYRSVQDMHRAVQIVRDSHRRAESGVGTVVDGGFGFPSSGSPA